MIDLLLAGMSDKTMLDPQVLVIQSDALGAERLARICAESRHDRCRAMTFKPAKRKAMLTMGQPHYVIVLEDKLPPSKRGAKWVRRALDAGIPCYVVTNMNRLAEDDG